MSLKRLYQSVWVFGFIVFIFGFVRYGYCQAEVETQFGKLRGNQKTCTEHPCKGKEYQEFLGVPYAQPPVGALRFKKPVPPLPWTGVKDATRYGYSCWQILPYEGSFAWFHLQGDTAVESEDCLTLNIFVPGKLDSNAPKHVLAFIHGGGYNIGTGNFYPAFRLATVADVIVVTFNYRLNVLGFLYSLDSSIEANLGLWDQRMALQWIKENIHYFGGDPNHVTLSGQSAGAASTVLQALSPVSRGLFERMISFSGTPISNWATSPVFRIKEATTKLADALECKIDAEGQGQGQGQNTGKTLAECIGAIIDKHGGRYLMDKAVPYFLYIPTEFLSFAFGPVVDGEFLLDDPKKIFVERDSKEYKFFADMDILAGATSAEAGNSLFSMFMEPEKFSFNVSAGIPRDFAIETIEVLAKGYYPQQSKKVADAMIKLYASNTEDDPFLQAQNMVDLLGDVSFVAPTVGIVNGRNGKGKTYLYYFDFEPKQHWLGRDSVFPSWYRGADHGDDLLFIFGHKTLLPDDFEVDSTEKVLTERMMKIVENFMKKGSVDWKSYEDEDKYYNHFFNRVSDEVPNELTLEMQKSNLLPERMNFWLETVPQILEEVTSSKQEDEVTSSKQEDEKTETIKMTRPDEL